MAGNSARRGAVRKAAKNTAGSGGRGRSRLEGRGPTPKAEDRTYHPAHQRKKAAQRAAQPADRSPGRPAGTGKGSPRGRAQRGPAPEMIAGRNSVLEALQAAIPAKALHVMFGHDNDDRVRTAIRLSMERSLPVHEVTRADLDRLTDGATHQGVALAVPAYEYAELADLLDVAATAGQAPLILALDGVTDPRNLGAVIRSAAAFGAHGVVVPGRRSAGVTSAAWKVSAGAAARVRVAKVTNLVRGLGELKKAGCFCYGLDAAGEVTLPQLGVGDDPVVIVLGAEQAGLSRLVRETCDRTVSIPMDRATESLNVSVAAGIALYEVARGRALSA